MKEQIYTIPLTEIMEEKPSCPLCALYAREEKKLVNYTLGPSMMEPDSREESNKEGFCAHHLGILLGSDGNKLSMALMLSTHFDGVISDLKKLSEKTPHPVCGMLKKKDAGIDLAPLHRRMDSCVMCRKIGVTMKRYAEVFLYLWDTEDDFRKKVKEGNGFCEKHMLELLELAPYKLKEEPCRDFISSTLKKQFEKASEERKNLSGFIDGFDYLKRKNNPGDFSSALSDTVIRLKGRE